MARIQDFQTVTPTSSDKLLVVQSQGQGLVPYGSKLDSDNPTGTGSLSLNRKSNTTVGTNSVAIGQSCTASGDRAIAMGTSTTASGTSAVAEGSSTTASGDYSHSEGAGTTASGERSHAEGSGTTASGNRSHAEGNSCTASGDYSHAEGYSTVSSGAYGCHAEGNGTIANHVAQHVFGAYNVADDSTAASTARGNYVEIVGKGGSGSNRSNARTLDWSGNETIAGTLTQSSDAKLKDIINEELPDVSSIKAVKFKWKENANRDESEHIGYIAQDVEKVLPYLVKEDAEGNKVLDYIAFLVAKIDSLEKRLAELEK